MAGRGKKNNVATIIPVYPREELLAKSEALFGVKPEVLHGALHGDVRAEFPLEEVKSMIKSFLKRRIS
ncbi:hypothetical protein ACOBQJ_02420 [Pelotomaculum propionicicum]|uniref:hypothetical protein n=1 Tax=Pelotomaculum propionicicum TaxID=258475 RepID=UPI003B82576C